MKSICRLSHQRSDSYRFGNILYQSKPVDSCSLAGIISVHWHKFTKRIPAVGQSCFDNLHDRRSYFRRRVQKTIYVADGSKPVSK